MEESCVPLPEMVREALSIPDQGCTSSVVKVRWTLLYTNEAGNNNSRIRYEYYRQGSINSIPAAYSYRAWVMIPFR